MKRQVRIIPRPEKRTESNQASERRFVNNFFPAAPITVTRCNIGYQEGRFQGEKTIFIVSFLEA
jgi:hypothetical protein